MNEQKETIADYYDDGVVFFDERLGPDMGMTFLNFAGEVIHSERRLGEYISFSAKCPCCGSEYISRVEYRPAVRSICKYCQGVGRRAEILGQWADDLLTRFTAQEHVEGLRAIQRAFPDSYWQFEARVRERYVTKNKESGQ